ncbi:MAG: hypothetical protein M9949_09015 [Candidatus Kapabacteria bacterium]|nr:hypothetical protein [Candidatus Kapabacteria bacterium]
MKKSLVLLVSITLFLLLCSMACDETTQPDPDKNLTGLVENETVLNEITKEYDDNDISLDFATGVSFKVTRLNNTGTAKQSVSISQIGGERYFNSPNNLVFDFSKMKASLVFELEQQLPSNLVAEDISVIIYSPGTSEVELDAEEIAFTYDQVSGTLRAIFAAPSDNPILSSAKGDTPQLQSGAGKYSRVNISWVRREELAEGADTRTIEMPFYEQPGNTCWATCAAMLGRAYTPVNDREKEIRIIDFVRRMGHPSLDEGLGLWAFSRTLPTQLTSMTDVKFEASSFVSKTNLLREIRRKLDQNIPVILNLRYPGVGAHVILVVGYEVDLVSAAKISVKLIYHNPQNQATDGFYKKADYDWLVKDKYATEAFQILYADQAVPATRALYTLGMPLKDYFGELSFIVPIKRPSDGRIIDFPVQMRYDNSVSQAYVWIYNLGNVKVEVIPDSATSMKLRLPVYNATKSSKSLHLDVRAYDYEAGGLIFEASTMKSCNSGTQYVEAEIPLSELVDNKKELDVMMKFALWDGGNYLDGYTIRFKLAPKKQIEFISMITVSGNHLTTCPDNSSEAEGNISVGAQKMMLNGVGKKYTGTSQDNTSSYRITRNVVLEYDSEVNPKYIKYLSIEMITEVLYDNALQGTAKVNMEMRDIEIGDADKVGSQLMLWRYESDVCKYIIDTRYKYTPEAVDGCSVDLLSYQCNSESQMYISIK